jgi:hypothetical protein
MEEVGNWISEAKSDYRGYVIRFHIIHFKSHKVVFFGVVIPDLFKEIGM